MKFGRASYSSEPASQSNLEFADAMSILAAPEDAMKQAKN